MDEIRDYYTNLHSDGSLSADEIEAKAQEFFDKYSFGNPIVKRWDFWSSFAGRSKMDFRKKLADERKILNFDEQIWYQADLNRDKSLSYDELIQNMSHDQAVEIYE